MGKPLKILIVEDQFVEANHLRIMLKKAGHSITGMARSVADAKFYLSEERPELVLLDIFLSGKGSGIDLAAQLKKDNIPFIYLSANSNEEILNKAKATHPYGFLVKPFRERDLMVTIEIAKYHEQFGIESSVRKEQLFQKQLQKMINQNGNWEDRLLSVSKALQPLIHFDLLMAVFTTDQHIPHKALGYKRIGVEEYQKIGMEEFQDIHNLKESEVKMLQQKITAVKTITRFNDEDFLRLCQKQPMKKLIADTMGMKSNLMLPIPLSINEGNFYLSFFSMQSHGYSASDFPLCERLQQPLIYAVENIISLEKKATEDDSILEKTTVVAEEQQIAFNGIVGKSPAILKLFDHIIQVAPADTTVLISGESGTGKESIARCIHAISSRNTEPYIRVNCALLPSGTVESELFGHEIGAFPGTSEQRIGKFELAHNGTLFLDEIGEMPLEIQAKVLHAIQEKEMERVGGNVSIKVNVRILAATSRNLEKEVAEGRFRLDLYYRLNVFPVTVPPLRERKEDIGRLVRHFIPMYSKKNNRSVHQIADSALKKLLEYHWPGNIRELENLIERSVLLSKTNEIITDVHLPLPDVVNSEIPNSTWFLKTIQENEKEHITYVLDKCNGRIRGPGGASEILGLPPTTLASRMQKLGIKRNHF